jgi:hypothetical protein
VLCGVLLGLVGSMGVLSIYDGGTGTSARIDWGPLLSDCNGTIR